MYKIWNGVSFTWTPATTRGKQSFGGVESGESFDQTINASRPPKIERFRPRRCNLVSFVLLLLTVHASEAWPVHGSGSSNSSNENHRGGKLDGLDHAILT
jgi:hypothetical protein